MTGSMFGRSTFTAAGWPSRSVAKCTCAIDALATGTRSNVAKISPHRLAERALDFGDGEVGRERRYPVLELRELVGDVGGQEVAARREHLAELDEDRPERFERAAQAHGAGRLVAAEEVERARTPEPAAGRVAGEGELVEAEAERDPSDLRETGEAAHALDYRPGVAPVRRASWRSWRRERRSCARHRADEREEHVPLRVPDVALRAEELRARPRRRAAPPTTRSTRSRR